MRNAGSIIKRRGINMLPHVKERAAAKTKRTSESKVLFIGQGV